MWIWRLLVSLLNFYLVYGSQDSLSDEEIIQGGKNISRFLWGFIFTLLSIVATWYYLNQEGASETSAATGPDKEAKVSTKTVRNLPTKESEKPALITSQVSKKVPVRLKGQNLASKLKSTAFDDGEASILCSKYDWEEKNGTNALDNDDSTDRCRRRSMEEMSLIFPGFLPKITEETGEEEEEEEEKSESLIRIEEIESEAKQTTDRAKDNAHNATISSSIEVNKTLDKCDRLESSVNTLGNKSEPVTVTKNGEIRFNDTNTVVKEKEYTRPNATQLASCNNITQTHKVLLEEPSIKSFMSEDLSRNPAMDINNGSSELNFAEALDGQANNEIPEDGKYDSARAHEHANLEAKKIISGNSERSESLLTANVITPQVNGYLTEKETVDNNPAIPEDKESLHFFNSCANGEEIITQLQTETQSSPTIDKGIEFDKKVKEKENLPQVSQQNTNALHIPLLKNDEQENNTIGCNFNEFTNILKPGNISELPVEPVMDDNLTNTHAWTFFSMSSEAEKADGNRLETDYLTSFEETERSKILVKNVVDPTSSDTERTSFRSTDISESKQDAIMDPHSFETDIDVDDIDLEDDEQLGEGELSLYLKRPVSVTNLDEIIETTGPGPAREKAESKRAQTSSKTEENRTVAEIILNQTPTLHNESNQIQETDLDVVDDDPKVEYTMEEETRSVKTIHSQTVNDQSVLFHKGKISRKGNIQNEIDDINDIGSIPDEVSIAVVTLETVREFEAAPDTLLKNGADLNSIANIGTLKKEKSYENYGNTFSGEELETTPAQVVEEVKDFSSKENVNLLSQNYTPGYNLSPSAEPIKDDVVVQEIDFTEACPDVIHDDLPESFVDLEDTHPEYEFSNKKREFSSGKAVCAEVEDPKVCSIEMSQSHYTTEENEDQTQFSVVPKPKKNFEESEATCVSQEKYELSDISLDKTDFVSDSESLSFTVETPEIIESDEASEIEDEFAEYTILNPTRTRSKYVVSGITRVPRRRSRSFNLKSFESKDIKSTKKSDFATKLQVDKERPGSLRIILTGKPKNADSTGKRSEKSIYSESQNIGNKIQPTNKHSLSKSTDELHEAKVKEISFGVEETVFKASTSEVEALPGSVSASTLSPLHSEDLIEPDQSPKTYTAKITMQENLPDRRRIIVLNVRKKSPGAARWKSMNDLDQMRSAITDITKELEEDSSHGGDTDQEPTLQRFRADTPVEIKVPYKDIQDTTQKGQTQENIKSTAVLPPTVRQNIHDGERKPEASRNTNQKNSLPLSPCQKEITETVFVLSAEPFSEKIITKQHEGMELSKTTRHQAELIDLSEETTFSAESETVPLYTDSRPVKSTLIQEQNTGEQEKSCFDPKQEEARKETTFPVSPAMVSVFGEPVDEKRSIFNQKPNEGNETTFPITHMCSTSVAEIDKEQNDKGKNIFSPKATDTSISPVQNAHKPKPEKSRSIFSPQPSDITPVSSSLVQGQEMELNKKSTHTVFAVAASPAQPPSRKLESKSCSTTHNQELTQYTNRSLSPVVVERKVHEVKGQKETVFVVSAEPHFGVNVKNKASNERKVSEDKKMEEEISQKKNSDFVVTTKGDGLKKTLGDERKCFDTKKAVEESYQTMNSVFGVFSKPTTVKAIPVGREKTISPSQEITVREVSITKKDSGKVIAKEIKKIEKTTHVKARLDPASETIVNVFSDEEDNARSPYRHSNPGKPSEPLKDMNDENTAKVIHAFPVNDGYDDDELDEVFVESGPTQQSQTEQSPTSSRISPSSVASQHQTSFSRDHRIGSYDADSETSSVQGELTPKLVRLRHVKESVPVASVRVYLSESDTDESSTTPTNLTPAPYLQESGASSDFEPYSQVYSGYVSDSQFPKDEGVITAAVVVGSMSNNPQYYEAFSSSKEKLTEESTEEEMQNLRLSKMSDDELPVFTGSAFRPVNGIKKMEVKKPHLSPDVFTPRTRSASAEEALLLAGQNYNKDLEDDMANREYPSLRGPEIGKSMPNLHKQEEIAALPNASKLSSHTRMWLSQNTGIDFDGEDVMTSELFLYPSSQLDLSMQDDMSDTLSTRPQSPMSEFSYAGEIPYAGLRRASKTVLTCANNYCHKEEILQGGEKTSFTSCPACFTYYCSRDCRRINWREHKKVCFFGRINSYIRSFVYYCNRKEELRLHLSKIAKSGYKKKGRGCVMVMFTSAQLARNFMTTGCKVFPSPPTYSSLTELKAEGKRINFDITWNK